jgi:hypothetical protein
VAVRPRLVCHDELGLFNVRAELSLRVSEGRYEPCDPTACMSVLVSVAFGTKRPQKDDLGGVDRYHRRLIRDVFLTSHCGYDRFFFQRCTRGAK